MVTYTHGREMGLDDVSCVEAICLSDAVYTWRE